MATETHSTTYKCPCGAGTVTRTVTDYDKMYVPDDITISWTCAKCKAEYSQVLSSMDGMLAIGRNGTRVLQRAEHTPSSEDD